MSQLTLNEVAAPGTPSTGKATVYVKTDGLVYAKDDTGQEYQLSWILADQAAQELATSVLSVVTSGRQQYHPSALKAWVRFNGTGTPSVAGGYSISSITDGGTGIYGVNTSVTFSDVGNMCAVSGAALVDLTPYSGVTDSNTFDIRTRAGGAYADVDTIFAVMAGDL